MGPQKDRGALQRLKELCKSPFHWEETNLLPYSRHVGQTDRMSHQGFPQGWQTLLQGLFT